MPKIAKKCILCKMTLDDPVKLGEFKTYKNISAHYYCLLLTTQLLQNGSDNQGILGFLPQDIRKEEQRISSQICYYCTKPSANLACCAPKCRRVFHLYCGLENSAICHFQDDFRTICNKHHKAERKTCTKNDNCVICCESMGQYHRVFSILAPCCRSGWFHKWCIAKFALNAGYFFKCPLCNNKDSFRNKLVHKGIFVPDQDATWELEPNAFADLLVRPDSCSAENCKCPRGRAYKSYPYTLNMCNTCGSNAMHRSCMEEPSDTYICEGCTGILTNSRVEPAANNASTANQDVEDEEKNNNESDDEDVDIVSVEKTSKWANEEPDDSVDSLLITFSRGKEGTEDGNGGNVGSSEPSDMSGDSVLFDDKASSKSVVISTHSEDISEEDIDYIYRSVRKRKPDLQRMDSDDLPLSAKRSKSSSSSLDSVFFDEINRSFSESDEQFALRMTDSPASSLEEVVSKSNRKHRKSVRSDSSEKTNATDNEIPTKPTKLKKVRSCDSYTSESFAGFESMPSLQVQEETAPIEKVSPLSNTNKNKIIRQRRMSEFMQRLPIVADEEEEEPELADNLYAVETASSEGDSDLPLSALISAKKCDPTENKLPAKTPRQSRIRARAKSTCEERPRAISKRRRSLRSRSKSISSPAPLAIRRSSRLREKPVEKIYKEDLIYVTDLKGDDMQRKAFKQTEILHLFVKRDIKLRQEYHAACKENYEANGGRRPRDSMGSGDREYQPPARYKVNDIIIRRKSENSGVIIFSQPSAFQPPGINRHTISNYDSGNLKHTFFEF